MIPDEVHRATSLELARAARAAHAERLGRCVECFERWPCAASQRIDRTIAGLAAALPRAS